MLASTVTNLVARATRLQGFLKTCGTRSPSRGAPQRFSTPVVNSHFELLSKDKKFDT